MIRSEPHPLSVFSLVPLNERSSRALYHPKNQPHVSYLPDYWDDDHFPGEARGINVGFNINSKRPCTLATIGRDADIVVSGVNISRVHCSFEIAANAEIFMLRDQSINQSTQFTGLDAIPLEAGRVPRQVVIHPTRNTEFGFGNANADLYQFAILWHTPKFSVPKYLLSQGFHRHRVELDEVETPTEDQCCHSATQPLQYIMGRAVKISEFGEVCKGIDAYTGGLLAIKRVKLSNTPDRGAAGRSMEVELENIREIHHASSPCFIESMRVGCKEANLLNVAKYYKDSLD
ncbi:hypothetical protein DIZ76_016964 [Coccidioides immitis]|uniref:FHA domain-containing protein n=1 Tax=Coccidioides immitis RMSCC 3703 TaxID=454286 RepID=A0A0J8TG35_COCIT|nr:hypothetical protein CISG_09778 [Coccidioides immitis RMSCC 3703]TPX19178.1 hypothetical protein DIZ76_016964 [Coccidioides immitis]